MASQTATAPETVPEPLQAPNRLAEIITAYMQTQAFVSACKLGLFDAMADVPGWAEDLAGRFKIHPVACRRLLVALAHMGLVNREGALFSNSNIGKYCASQSSVNLGPIIGFTEPFYRMFEFLPDALCEYGPRYRQALSATKEDVFAALYEDPARVRVFALFMKIISVPQGELIAERFDFSPYHCIMDVAGGPGGQSIPIGQRHKHIGGNITDLAPVCEVAREYIAAAGLTDRFTAVPADLFKGPYPQGSDVIILGHILHDWNDDSCLKILRNCYDALPAGAALLITESVLNPDYSASTFALMKDLTMIVACAPDARERTEAEYRALLDQCGFEVIEVMRFDASRDLIVAKRK
jgi:hypothetical protein